MNGTQRLKKAISGGLYDGVFAALYPARGNVAGTRERYLSLLGAYETARLLQLQIRNKPAVVGNAGFSTVLSVKRP
jgi:hypothetical protein